MPNYLILYWDQENLKYEIVHYGIKIAEVQIQYDILSKKYGEKNLKFFISYEKSKQRENRDRLKELLNDKRRAK